MVPKDAMALDWKRSLDGVKWEELSALYRAAPLGDKKPAHQGTGLGKQLVSDLVERSRGHKKIILYAVRAARAPHADCAPLRR